VSAEKTSKSVQQRYAIRSLEIRGRVKDDDELFAADGAYCELARETAVSSQDAADKLDKIAAFYAARQLSASQASALYLAGQYLTKLSEFKKVAARYAEAARAFESAGDGESRARTQETLAQTWTVLRDYPAAIDTASKTLELARQMHLPAIEAGALTTMGRALAQTGEQQRGLECIQQALALTHNLGDPAREAAALYSAAVLYRSLGSFEKALDLYHDALVIYRRLGDRLSEAAILNGVGGTYGYTGQPAKALENFQQAIAILRDAPGGRLALATSLSNSGQALLSTHQPEKAIAALEEALSIFRDTGSRWDQVYTLATLGRARHSLNDLDGAAETLGESLRMKEENDDPAVEACTRLDFARLERTRGNAEAALAQITAAIDVFESVRNRVLAPDLRSSLIASVSEYYELQVDTLMQL
jgi:tetratricopeptide (TPR) repeat protein